MFCELYFANSTNCLFNILTVLVEHAGDGRKQLKIIRIFIVFAGSLYRVEAEIQR
jgi:hypothetical protein